MYYASEIKENINPRKDSGNDQVTGEILKQLLLEVILKITQKFNAAFTLK